ncbi:MAG TPA: hypothetical protein DCS66_16815 [Flavobacteriaceae bacterium]|nr:hypothetical protein [Flavobacteriaceae bacterium]|tara:strand:+ start:209 stop:397 length:189 start_codon:yes stop_codon:yes gene_type:complete
MLNIFRKFEELDEIKLELQRIEIQFERVEWILDDLQSELGKVKAGMLSRSLQRRGRKNDSIL